MSTENKAFHRLSAILFADIQGFTSLMQRDEVVGSQLLNKFQDEMYAKVSSFNGRVVNEMGDGMLCVFDSPNDAVRCAMILKTSFEEIPKVPVRIGIHSGTVIFEKDKVYGDSVNVASRIESIGVPGAVLFSERVRKDLKNQKDIEVAAIGKHRFKNVEEPLSIYAVANEGFVVPAPEDIRLKLNQQPSFLKIPILILLILFITVLAVLGGNWNPFSTQNKLLDSAESIRKEKLAVLQFSNETGDSTLNYLGLLVARLISQRLSAVNDINLLSSTIEPHKAYTEVLLGQLGYSPEFTQSSNVDNVISGAYYLFGDSLMFHSEIIKAQSGQVLKSFDEQWTPRNEPHRGIESLGQQILGFWVNKDNPLFLKDFPRADAYEEYLKAISLWGNDSRRVLQHLNKCLEIDSNFVRAYLLKGRFFSNMGQFDLLDSLLVQLEPIELDMDEGERNLYQHLKADLAGNSLMAYNYYKNEYELSPKDLFINNSVMDMALIMVNNAEDAVRYAEEIDHKILDLNKCHYCRSRVSLHARALINLGNYESALNVINEIPLSDPIDVSIKGMEIRALARLGKIEELKTLIQQAENQRFSGGRDHNYFYFRTAEEFALLNKAELVHQFAEPAIETYSSENSPENSRRLGRLYLLTREFEKAEVHFKNTDPKGGYYLAQLGAALGFQGKEKDALGVMNLLEEQRSPNFPGWADYFAAQIWASLGKREMALDAISKAISRGKRFYFWQFQYDPIFIDLFNDPEFQDLLVIN